MKQDHSAIKLPSSANDMLEWNDIMRTVFNILIGKQRFYKPTWWTHWHWGNKLNLDKVFNILKSDIVFVWYALATSMKQYDKHIHWQLYVFEQSCCAPNVEICKWFRGYLDIIEHNFGNISSIFRILSEIYL